MATTITNPVSYGGKNEQLAIGQGVMKAFAAGRADKLKRDYFQQTILDQENEKIGTVYDSINTIPQTGIDTFDSNINRFFNQGADRIFEVKNLINDGHMTQQEGMKIISETNNYINKYKTLAPKIVEQIKYYNDAKANGSFSRINDNGMAAMLDAISNGSGDVQLLEKEGMMYLSGAGSLDTKGGKEDWKYTMNIDKLGNLLADPSFAMIKTIPTFEDLGIDEIFDAQKGLLNGALTQQQTTDENGVVTTKNVYNPEILGELMVKKELYADLLNDPEMGVVWSDSVHATDEVGSFKPWDPNNKDMRDKMEAWLIDKAITRNIPPNEITQVQYPTPGTPSVGAGFASSLFGEIAVDIKEYTDLQALDPFIGDEDNENFKIEIDKQQQKLYPNDPSKWRKVIPTSITLPPNKAIELLNKFTTGDNMYTILDADSTDDILASAYGTIDALTLSDFTSDGAYSDNWVGGTLEENKQLLKDEQKKLTEDMLKSLTPGKDGQRDVVVIRKGELTPTKISGNINSVLKEIIENTDYISSSKEKAEALRSLEIFTNPKKGGFDINKWRTFEKKQIGPTYNTDFN
tara:strand:- start:3123 stop:4850 length:1728 start_codon:yes stop_codon:yes gene_type:complete